MCVQNKIQPAKHENKRRKNGRTSKLLKFIFLAFFVWHQNVSYFLCFSVSFQLELQERIEFSGRPIFCQIKLMKTIFAITPKQARQHTKCHRSRIMSNDIEISFQFFFSSASFFVSVVFLVLSLWEQWEATAKNERKQRKKEEMLDENDSVLRSFRNVDELPFKRENNHKNENRNKKNDKTIKLRNYFPTLWLLSESSETERERERRTKRQEQRWKEDFTSHFGLAGIFACSFFVFVCSISAFSWSENFAGSKRRIFIIFVVVAVTFVSSVLTFLHLTIDTDIVASVKHGIKINSWEDTKTKTKNEERKKERRLATTFWAWDKCHLTKHS